ncbi:tetratricopeptide repeat protein [Stigmatella aurantiaca]|nr:tetratricopeptide repeat protein [Stigmatella aurantiaca]
MAAVHSRAESYEQKLADGRTALAAHQPERASRSFREAANLRSEAVEPLLLLAEAYRVAGNEGPAILALKEAEAIAPGEDPAIQKQMAELYRRGGHIEQAITTLVALRDRQQLTDPELLSLARLQARQGSLEAAFKSLEPIQKERPDDPDAKVVEAEILLLKGDELLAARLMDRLITDNPGLMEARMLRVRYFLNSGFVAEAEQDLMSLAEEDAVRPEVILLRARILNRLERPAEADTVLTQLVAAEPTSVEALSMLAETKLLLGQNKEAQALVEKVLRLRSRYPRALYVRARALEAQGDKAGAVENYSYALSSDPRFAPALSRMWRIHRDAGRKMDAMTSLEQIHFIGEASIEEKVALAQMYAESKIHLERGRKLIDEALAREPGNPDYVSIKAALTDAMPKKKKSKGPIILRGGR